MRKAIVIIGLIALLVLATIVVVHAANAGSAATGAKDKAPVEADGGIQPLAYCNYVCPYCPAPYRRCDVGGRCC